MKDFHDKQDQYYAKIILEFRGKWKLTQSQMARVCGLKFGTLSNYERALTTPSPEVWRRITATMHDFDGTMPVSREIYPERINGSTRYRFTPGAVYSIHDTVYAFGTIPFDGFSEINTFFRYVGLQGIHHVFRHVAGNWTRTYTDSQLIGKTIEEVPE